VWLKLAASNRGWTNTQAVAFAAAITLAAVKGDIRQVSSIVREYKKQAKLHRQLQNLTARRQRLLDNQLQQRVKTTRRRRVSPLPSTAKGDGPAD
jgi:hypothetical protein